MRLLVDSLVNARCWIGLYSGDFCFVFACSPASRRNLPFSDAPLPFPDRPPADPAMVDGGKALYGVHCTFCHGPDARGGSGGINLIRNQMMLNNQNEELIGQALREGREAMPKFNPEAKQVSDIAAFIHSFKVGGYDVSRMTPTTIITGDAKLGEAYFVKTCADSICWSLLAIRSSVSIRSSYFGRNSNKRLGASSGKKYSRCRL